ncbi:MAG: hypothetical protein WBW71_04065 [Bacteroidota bacterium]
MSNKEETEIQKRLTDILTMLVRSLCENDGEMAKVELKLPRQDELKFVISVPEDQRGFVVGLRGKTIEALRLILRKIAWKYQYRIYICLEGEEEGVVEFSHYR